MRFGNKPIALDGIGTPIAIHSPTELEPSSSDLAASSKSSSSSEPEYPTTPTDAATPQDDIP